MKSERSATQPSAPSSWSQKCQWRLRCGKSRRRAERRGSARFDGSRQFRKHEVQKGLSKQMSGGKKKGVAERWRYHAEENPFIPWGKWIDKLMKPLTVHADGTQINNLQLAFKTSIDLWKIYHFLLPINPQWTFSYLKYLREYFNSIVLRVEKICML